jgi:hypothetical protein
MKIKVSLLARLRRKLAAFSLAEAAVGMGVVGTTVAALFSGIATGFFTIRMARENLRATQIMLEKVETIRLYSWWQVTSNGYIPVSFTNKYDPVAQTGNDGLHYYGTMEIDPAVGFHSAYTNNMRLVKIRLNWKTGNLARSREFRSYISRSGLQDYVY